MALMKLSHFVNMNVMKKLNGNVQMAYVFRYIYTVTVHLVTVMLIMLKIVQMVQMKS